MSEHFSQQDLKNINLIKLQKMTLIFNAIEDGWTIQKIGDEFICDKKHEGRKEVLSDEYLNTFMEKNLTLKNILC